MKNFFLTCKECILENPRNFYGCFYLGPFNSSQSLTVANGLRRTLLSEIPGLGIQSIEIEGVEHEFCNYVGLRESILDLLLNFKEIVLKYNSIDEKNQVEDTVDQKKSKLFSKKPLYGYLQARGPGIIRASDLKLPPSIVSVDPNQYIATLTTDGVLNLRFTICEGFTSMQKSINRFNLTNKELIAEDFSWFTNGKNKISNLQSENSRTTSLSKNKKIQNSRILWLDPVFTPVLKVNYVIESFGSVELNQANQVILLELWTNGSIHPRDALYKALSELNTMFSKLEKMKILNSLFSQSILNSNKFYPKMLKKVKYNYGYYKSNAKNQKILNLKQNIGISPIDKNLEILSNTDNQKSLISFKDLGIESLELPFRIKNCLINANILTIQSLLSCQINDLKKIPGMGHQSIMILLKKLNEKGLKLNKK